MFDQLQQFDGPTLYWFEIVSEHFPWRR